jgi:hypothetical protein
MADEGTPDTPATASMIFPGGLLIGLLIVVAVNFVGLGASMVSLVALIIGLAAGLLNLTRAGPPANFMIGMLLLAIGLQFFVAGLGGIVDQIISAVAKMAGTAGTVAAVMVLLADAQS